MNYQITACTYVCPTPPDSLTVAGLIVCSASGVEGWCRGSATLNLTATDALNHAVAFTGSGVAGFPCTAPCAISLPQGQGSVSFTGTCTGGLTAAGGPLPWKLDLTNPTITSASLSGGTAGGGGWYRAGPVNLNCSATDALSGVRGIAYNPQTATANGTTTLRCTATDKAGNAAQTAQAVRIDAAAPDIAGSLSGGTAGSGGWYRAGPVNLNCTATDAHSGVQGVAYNPRTATANGSTTLKCTATDVAGNSTSYSKSVSIDATMPVVSSSVSGGNPGGGGWYFSGPVTMSCSATDTFSGLQGITYNPQTATANGTTTLRCTATDKAGNSTQATQPVRIDGVAPSIAGSISSAAPGNNGWFRGPASLNCAATDAHSGVNAVAYNPQTATANGATTLRCSATDVAGNSAQYAQAVNIDATAPVVSGSVSGGNPANGGWYFSGPVTMSCSATDTFSGLQGITYNPQTANGDGQAALRCTATDKAGNNAQATQTVRIDGTAPTITTSISSSAPGNAGWYRGPASLVCTAADATSGVQEVTYDPQTATADGESTLACTASDRAGNTSQTSQLVRIDSRAPGISASLTGGIPGGGGWYLSGPVTLACTAADSLSGVRGITYSPQTADGDGKVTLACTATDAAGNSAQALRPVQIDGAPPALTGSVSGVSGSNGWYRGPASLDCEATDATSGVQGITYSPRTAVTDGSTALACTASDRAGNSAGYSQTVNIDATAPVVSSMLVGGTPGSNGWYTAGPVNLNCNATDATSGVKGIAYAEQTADGEGWVTLACSASDDAGNTAQESRQVGIDGTAPTVTGSVSGGTPGGGGWYLAGPVSLDCSASDAVSGLQEITYNPKSASADGETQLACAAADRAGNIGRYTASVSIDATAPEISGLLSGGTPGRNGWYTAGPVSLQCEAADPVSGVARLTYETQTATAPGGTVLSCSAQDTAGNTGKYSTVASIDNVPPAAHFEFGGQYCADGWYRSAVTVSLAATDAHSGVASAQFSLDGGATWKTSFTAGEGSHALVGKASDVAGNSAVTVGRVSVDMTEPQSAWDVEEGRWVGGTAELGGHSTDSTSGVARIEISTDRGGTWTEIGSTSPWIFRWETAELPDGEYRLSARAFDNACNGERTAAVTVRVDNTPPRLTLRDSIVAMGGETEILAEDEGSGLGNARVTISGAGITPRIIDYPTIAGTADLAWDGRDGKDKTVPPGEYDVLVEVRDNVGNYSSTTGKWLKSLPGESSVLDVPPAAVDPVSPEPADRSVPAQTESRSARTGVPFWILILPPGGLTAWLVASCAALTRDRRWEELRGLRASLAAFRKQDPSCCPGGNEDD